MKKLLHLYNYGHNPFPKNGKGGLGYHLPQYRIKGRGGIEQLNGDITDTGPDNGTEIFSKEGKTIIGEVEYDDEEYDEDGNMVSYTVINHMFDPESKAVIDIKESKKFIDENTYDVDEDVEYEKPKPKSMFDYQKEYPTLYNKSNKELSSMIKNINEKLGTKYDITGDKLTMINRIKSIVRKHNLVKENNKGIPEIHFDQDTRKGTIKLAKKDLYKNRETIFFELFGRNNPTMEMLKDYFKKNGWSGISGLSKDELIELFFKNEEMRLYSEVGLKHPDEPEEQQVLGFVPEGKQLLDSKIIDDIKSKELVSDDNISDDKELITTFDEFRKDPNKYVELIGDTNVKDLMQTTDKKLVYDLLYDESGIYKPGTDMEDKVLANTPLVKNILISTYGSNRLNLDNLDIKYSAKKGSGDEFTVFDAHAVKFVLDGKSKEAFIEFKKYSNYVKDISDVDVMLKNEKIQFENFVAETSKNIQNVNEEISNKKLLYEDTDNKKEKQKLMIELKQKEQELKILLNEFNPKNKEDFKLKFYEFMNPVGVGVKYTKFPPLPSDLKHVPTSVNSPEAYNYIQKYENNPHRRKSSNVKTHKKSKKKDIDILIVTGLAKSMVVCNVSKIIQEKDNPYIERLKLKKTVYSTKQIGTKTPDYDHYNIPISYFKNVKLNTEYIGTLKKILEKRKSKK